MVLCLLSAAALPAQGTEAAGAVSVLQLPFGVATAIPGAGEGKRDAGFYDHGHQAGAAAGGVLGDALFHAARRPAQVMAGVPIPGGEVQQKDGSFASCHWGISSAAEEVGAETKE